MAALCSRQQNSASAGVAGRSVIAGVARLAGSVPPADSPGIAPGPADGCADGGGFGGWLPLWSCIPAACPVPDAGNVRTVWGRIPSQPPTTRQLRTFSPTWRCINIRPGGAAAASRLEPPCGHCRHPRTAMAPAGAARAPAWQEVLVWRLPDDGPGAWSLTACGYGTSDGCQG